MRIGWVSFNDDEYAPIRMASLTRHVRRSLIATLRVWEEGYTCERENAGTVLALCELHPVYQWKVRRWQRCGSLLREWLMGQFEDYFPRLEGTHVATAAAILTVVRNNLLPEGMLPTDLNALSGHPGIRDILYGVGNRSYKLRNFASAMVESHPINAFRSLLQRRGMLELDRTAMLRSLEARIRKDFGLHPLRLRKGTR